MFIGSNLPLRIPVDSHVREVFSGGYNEWTGHTLLESEAVDHLNSHIFGLGQNSGSWQESSFNEHIY